MNNSMNNELQNNLDRLHTTELGLSRIRKNLDLDISDIVDWCKQKVLTAGEIFRQGKNWYANCDDCVITINAHSYTIITAHKRKHIAVDKVDMSALPNPNATHPVQGFPVTYVKPTITRPNIIVGDFTYYSGEDFESRVTHHYEYYGDKLIIGKFCQIAAEVEFIMNGANHKMDGVSTFPFYIFAWEEDVPPLSDMPHKGDTIVGNDVWIGQNAVILPGVHIGDGAIIGASSVVGSNVDPYTIVVGNPAKAVRKRFDDELIALMQEFKWWDKGIDEIQDLIPLLHDNDLEHVKREIERRLEK